MSEQYQIKPDSFLSSVLLGSDAGPSNVDPRLRQLIATKRGTKELAEGQVALLVGQKQELQLHAQSLREQHRTAESVESMEHTMSDGLGQVSQSLTDGFSGLADGMQQLGSGLQNLGSGMQSGFSHLSNGMSHLAKGVDRGFQTLDRRMQAGLGEVAYEVREASLLNVLSIAALNRNTQAGFGPGR